MHQWQHAITLRNPDSRLIQEDEEHNSNRNIFFTRQDHQKQKVQDSYSVKL